MGRKHRILGALVALLAAPCALATPALASSAQESILMDDNNLIYSSPLHVIRTLERIRSLGVDRVKVSVVWSIVVPRPRAHHRPHFDASNPDAYPSHAWDRYDLIARAAPALGMRAYFELNPPAPAWAVPNRPPSQGYASTQLPDTKQYEKFAEAVGRRYSGSYVPPGQASAPSSSLLNLPIDIPGVTRGVAGSREPPVPRVDYWGIWNEPNEAAWLNPQWNHISNTLTVLRAPALYRGLVDAAWKALTRTGHGHDTILIGETASRGWILPVKFVEALYCVDSSLRPLSGQSASNVTCPRSGNSSSFLAAHPGLFNMRGYAHHPYSFDVAPDGRPQFVGEITLAKLGGFESVLSRILGVYGRGRRGGLPLYLTEWGYKTHPPNPFVHTSQRQQALWLNQGEYMTYRLPWVRALTQFLLIDDAPRAGAVPGSRQYWSTPDTGLLNLDGSPKPAYRAYRIPIWLPSRRHGSNVTIWGQLRPADHTGAQVAVLYYKRNGGKWTPLRAIQTANSKGFLIAHVSIPAAGKVKLAWASPRRHVYYSRVVSLS